MAYTTFEQLVEPIAQWVSSNNESELISWLDEFANLSLDVDTVLRPSLEEYTRRIGDLEDGRLLLRVAQHGIELLRDRIPVYPNEILKFGVHASEVLVDEEDYSEAASILCSFNIDQNDCFTPHQKVDILLQTSHFYLKMNDPVSASKFVNRTHRLMNSIDDSRLQALYRTKYAQVLDSERRFLDASVRYMSIGRMESTELYQEAVLDCLQQAITCSILAKAGPRRSRILAMLHDDTRTKQLPNFGILESMYRDRIVRAEEYKAFEQLLKPHQNTTMSDGNTILTRAVLEHNLFAVSKLYSNISFDHLALLLDTTVEQAEERARAMIQDGRMSAMIDQVENFIHFTSPKQLKHQVGELQYWDRQIEATSRTLNEVVDLCNAAAAGQ